MKRFYASILSLALVTTPMAAGADSSSSSSTSSASSTAGAASALPAFAVTPENEAVVIPTELASSCLSNPNKDLCIPDMLKQLQRARVAFINQQRRKRNAWKEEHASMGRTQEYLDMLRDFSNQMKKESDAFNQEIIAATKKLHDAQKGRTRTGGSSSLSSRSSSASSVDQAELAKCEKVTDDVKRRVCIRAVTNKFKQRLTTGKTYR